MLGSLKQCTHTHITDHSTPRSLMERPLAVLAALAGAAAALLFGLRRQKQGGRSSRGRTGGNLAGTIQQPHAAKARASAAIGEELSSSEAQAAVEAETAAAAAAAQRAASPLYRVTRNEVLVHNWLLRGQEGGLPFLPPFEPGMQAAAPAHLAAGRAPPVVPSAAPLVAAPVVDEEALDDQEQLDVGVQQAVRETVERAFFDALADGLRQGQTHRLAALLLDARDQLAALLPAATSSGGRGEGQELLVELREKLDAEYVQQRLQRYDSQYCAQCFDLLLHIIARLQAPARRQHTQQQYAKVAALFASAAAQAASGVAVASATATTPTAPTTAAAAQPAGELEVQVRLQLSCGSSSRDSVLVQLMPLDAATAAGQLEKLHWQLRLAPNPAGSGAVTTLGPSLASSATDTAAVAGTAAEMGGGAAASAAAGTAVDEASKVAAVAAARFLLRQLQELKGDVARARLAILKEAVLGSSGGIDYERARLARALAASGSGSSRRGSRTEAAVLLEVFPITCAWLRRVLLEAPPPPNLQGAARCRACVCAGLLQLAQLPHAVGVDECPETLLLDLRSIVGLQNELQRLCLQAASLLIAQQILAAQHVLPPVGSPPHTQLCERVVARMGALLVGGAGMEGLVLELHRQMEEVMAQQAQQQHGAQHQQGEQQQKGEQQGQRGSLDVEVVRRMVSRIFSTDDAVYQRVQAGVVAAVTTLLHSNSTCTATGASSSSAGSSSDDGSGAITPWHRVLRGVGAQSVVADVYRFAAQVYRIAAVSTAVAEALVYVPLLQHLEQTAAAAGTE